MPFRKKALRYVKKQARRAGKYLKKRYVSKGSLNLTALKKDVMKLKTLVNAEKKSTDDQDLNYRVASQNIAQLNVNNTGAYIGEISPFLISQGTNYNQRTGNSIKLHALVIKGQIIGQIGLNNKMRIILEVWMRRAQDITTTSVVFNELFNVNNFTAPKVVDYNSQRDRDHFSGYARIASKHVVLSADTINSQITQVNNFTIPMKLRQHAKWNTANTYIAPQYFITARCDTGNLSASNIGTVTGVPTNALSTGAILSYTWQYFFYDN